MIIEARVNVVCIQELLFTVMVVGLLECGVVHHLSLTISRMCMHDACCYFNTYKNYSVKG